MGSHLFLSARAASHVTVESVADAARQRWPGIRLYQGQGGKRQLGFFAPVDGDQIDFEFFEGSQFVTVDLGQGGAEIGEWFLRLAPENVPWVVFTELETEPVRFRRAPPPASCWTRCTGCAWGRANLPGLVMLVAWHHHSGHVDR